MVNNDDGRLLLGSILGFGAGIYTFLKGFRQYRKYRLVADTPAIRIRSMPMGLVQVRGEARSEETLLSPVTRTPCYMFKVEVEEWRSDSDRGGEWKHVATDIQSVKFDVQDASGNVLIDATNAELDLPAGPTRDVRSYASPRSSAQAGATAAARHTPATDADLLQYVEQARMRHLAQMVGRGVSMVSRAAGAAREPQRPSLLGMLADPTGPGAEGFRNQIMKAALARQDPNGVISRLALEVWKHPQGSPEFESALVHVAQAYSRTMASTQNAFDPSTVVTQARQNPQVLAMVAMAAGSLGPQADPEAEKARQVALTYGREQMAGMMRQATPTATGHYRLKEYCLLPGQTCDITGTCAENPHPRDEFDRNIILKGTNEPTFLISYRTDKQVQSWLWRQSLWMVLGGAALAVVCLAIILGKLGLL